jgi:hypothetical protein
MARKAEPTDPTLPADAGASPVVSGDAVILPQTAAPSTSDVVSLSSVARTGGRKLTATEAGSACALFPAGGSAFGVWCVRQGIPATERRSASDWGTLLSEFATRSIHGHRRSLRSN